MIIKTTPSEIDGRLLEQAVTILKNGGLIVFPTETAYGIGCDAFNKEAIKKIYEIKKRSKELPLPVIVSSKEMIERIAFTTPKSLALMDKFYPGPLVIALQKKEVIPDELNKNSIAFRISSNPIINKIVAHFNDPIVATSANLSGDKTPYSIDDVKNSLSYDRIDLVIDVGILDIRKPSTLIDFTLSPSPQIIRIGEISSSEIFNALNIPEKEWDKHIEKS